MKVFITGGLGFVGTLYNTQVHPYVTDMAKKGLLRHVSIEAIAKEIVKEGDDIVAKGLDITGLGVVKTPGIEGAYMAIAEAFKNHDSVKGELPPGVNTDTEKKKEENIMTEEEKPKEEETKEETEEKPKETPSEEKESTKTLEVKLPEEFKTVSKTVEDLKKQIETMKESKSKGIVTEEAKPKYKLKFESNAKKGKDFYVESLGKPGDYIY